MDKPFNHLIICLTFVMPVAALSVGIVDGIFDVAVF